MTQTLQKWSLKGFEEKGLRYKVFCKSIEFIGHKLHKPLKIHNWREYMGVAQVGHMGHWIMEKINGIKKFAQHII